MVTYTQYFRPNVKEFSCDGSSFDSRNGSENYATQKVLGLKQSGGFRGCGNDLQHQQRERGPAEIAPNAHRGALKGCGSPGGEECF